MNSRRARLLLLLAVTVALAAQQSQPAPRFEVVSIKLDPPPSGVYPPTGPRTKVPGFTSPDTWTCSRIPVSTIVALAFEMPKNEIIGLPAWADSTAVEIVAKLPAGTSHRQFPNMMQAMLADRFQLSAHRADQVIDVRWVELAKGGSKLQPARMACTDDPNVSHINTCCVMPRYLTCQLGLRSQETGCANLPPPRCGDVARSADFPNYQYGVDYSGVGATIGDLVHALNENGSGAPYVDHTGLQGRFDFLIKVDMTPLPAADGSATPSAPGEMQSATERAWRDQAGLSINYRDTHKEPFPVLVIDHLAKPVEN